MSDRCWHCRAKDSATFDRCICACGAMHYFCGNCGSQLDDCDNQREENVEPLEKAAVIDKRGLTALELLHKFIGDHPDEILGVAKGRHILGHYEYGDTNLFEWTDGKVRAAIIEELADAVVYQAWLEERAAGA